jgi:hypothetical protein
MIGGILVDVPSQAATTEKRHRGPDPDERAPWLGAGFTGAVICGVLGPALPLLVLITGDAFRQTRSFREALRALEVFPITWPLAIMLMGPGGAVLGTLGALWIRFRSKAIASRRLVFETGFIGTLLGRYCPDNNDHLRFGWLLGERVYSVCCGDGNGSGLCFARPPRAEKIWPTFCWSDWIAQA